MITKELRNQLFESGTPAQRYLYGDPRSGAELLRIATTHQLADDTHYHAFALTVGDIILGFYQIKDTVPLLQQELGVDPRTAALLGADVLAFLAPLSDPTFVPPAEDTEPYAAPTVDTTSETAINPIPPVPAVSVTSTTTIAAPLSPEILSPVAAPVSTPAVDTTPTYASYQPTAPTPAATPLSTIPSYQPAPTPPPLAAPAPDRPRWSSDW